MTTAEIEILLRSMNTNAFERDGLGVMFESLPENVRTRKWLGNPPASETQIRDAEQRLDVRLPPSYVNFLRVANGFHRPSTLIPRLLSASEIEWFRSRHSEIIDIWISADGNPADGTDDQYLQYGSTPRQSMMRLKYLKDALQISGPDTNPVVLLNPQIQFDDGEWEAWLFGAVMAGAQRYKSFTALLLDHHLDLLLWK
jgi:hypothetical protein